MEVENIYPVTEPVGSEQDAPVSNMEMLSDVFFKEEARRLKKLSVLREMRMISIIWTISCKAWKIYW